MSASRDVANIDWGLKPLHNKLLEMLCYIHDFCEQHNIEYCLAYGTALGAARHQGFIPWDDDVDIYMTLENYEKFRSLFMGEKNSKYYLQEIRPIDGMVSDAKLRCNGTTLIEPLYEKFDMHQGIYIDIFILFPVVDKKFERVKMHLANQYLVLKELSNRNYNRRRLYMPIMVFLRLFPKNFLRKQALKILYKYKGNNTALYYDTDLRKYSRSFWETRTIFPAKTVKFEDVNLCVPNDIDFYLRVQYGEYNKIPSVESIRNSQHAAEWYVDVDFCTILPHINDFRDEKE